MYKAPIELISSPPKFDIDGEIYTAVVKCGVSVDKDELIKALQYDRDQYDKGYSDAKAEVAMEIFEEIEKIITEPFTVGFDLLSPLNQALREYNNGIRKELLHYVAELKKKYTEDAIDTNVGGKVGGKNV